MLNFFYALLESVTVKVTAFISALGYWGLAAGMAVESANIPLPSEIILPFGGYLVYTGRLTFWGAVMAGTLGGLGGSIISYYAGLKGGRPLLKRYGRYVGVSEKHFNTAERWFNRYGEWAVFFGRLLPVIRTFISLPAGIAHMNMLRFIIYSFLGSLPWSILLVYLGVKLGENWNMLKPYFHRFDFIILAGMLICIIYWWMRRRKTFIN